MLHKYIFYNKKGKYIINPPNELYQSILVSMESGEFWKMTDIHTFLCQPP